MNSKVTSPHGGRTLRRLNRLTEPQRSAKREQTSVQSNDNLTRNSSTVSHVKKHKLTPNPLRTKVK